VFRANQFFDVRDPASDWVVAVHRDARSKTLPRGWRGATFSSVLEGFSRLPSLLAHEFGPVRKIASAHGEFRACRLCGASRGEYETGETVWADLDGSQLPSRVAHHLDQQCPGPSGRLRDYYGLARTAVASLASGAPSDEERPAPCGANILVVDDDADARNALADLLEADVYSVSCARDGKEALERLKVSPTPSLVIVDLLMPVMDGWQFRAEQKRDPSIGAIPVVILTALRQVPDMDDAVAVFHKPVDVTSLLEVVRRCCRDNAQPAEK